MSWECYTKPVSLPFKLPTRIYGAMLLVWHLSPGLQRKYCLHKFRPSDYIQFIAWCAFEGRSKYELLRQLPEWDQELQHNVVMSRKGCDLPVVLFLAGVFRKKCCHPLYIFNAKTMRVVSSWFDEEGMRRLGLSSSVCLGLENVTTYKELFKPSEKTGDTIYRLLPMFMLKLFRNIGLKYRSLPAEAELQTVTGLIDHRSMPKQTEVSHLPFGVNLYGYARGELGIGEDVRLLARALNEVGVPFCIINVQPGQDVSQKDQSVTRWFSDSPVYAINIFCMTGIENARYVAENGTSGFIGRYTIGLWPWELPEWPKSWYHACGLVDEIWGISHYTSRSYGLTGVQVHTMPLAVTIDDVPTLQRSVFNLPENTYLFFFAFDYNSTMSRKNPEGLVEAFQLAFPVTSGASVALVIKVSHAKSQHKRWMRFVRRVKADSRIILIEKTFRKSELIGLYRCCDCLVSLHRAEGFGRLVAESLMLGKKVITTNFSGNMDYCNSENAGLVDVNMKFIKEREYFSGEGQRWAEPSLATASALMRQYYESGNYNDSGSNGMQGYTLQNAGKAYQKRLKTIFSVVSGKSDS